MLMLLLFIILLFIFFKISLHIPKLKGKKGEKRVAQILSELPQDKYIVLNDILLDTDKGTSQIDHVILSIYGIFVIETKNYKGWILGGEKSDMWIKNVYGKKYEFHNPLKQNYGHKKQLQKYLYLPSDKNIISIIAFSNLAEIKVQTTSNVVNFRNLISCISTYNTRLFSKEEILKFYDLLKIKQNYSKETEELHIKTIQEKIKKEDEKISEKICPRCGGTLVTRTGKYGVFYGCSNFPRCRFTKKI